MYVYMCVCLMYVYEVFFRQLCGYCKISGLLLKMLSPLCNYPTMKFNGKYDSLDIAGTQLFKN